MRTFKSKWVASWKVAVSGIAVCAGLLVDFKDAVSKMSAAIPIIGGVIGALVPILAIGGAVYSTVSLIELIVRNRPPSRFKNLEQEISDVTTDIVSYQSRLDIGPHGSSVYRSSHQPLSVVQANTRRLKIKLEQQFLVACPLPIETDGSNINLWERFLADLAGHADSRDLNGAKSLLERLTS